MDLQNASSDFQSLSHTRFRPWCIAYYPYPVINHFYMSIFNRPGLEHTVTMLNARLPYLFEVPLYIWSLFLFTFQKVDLFENIVGPSIRTLESVESSEITILRDMSFLNRFIMPNALLQLFYQKWPFNPFMPIKKYLNLLTSRLTATGRLFLRTFPAASWQ